MGKKIYVSYKYSDSSVLQLNGIKYTTVRDYVNKMDSLLTADDHIYKGEDDGEDLSSLMDATIASKLGDKIFDSSITIVLISRGMKEFSPEREQWIPWEISYSLKEQSRNGQTSKTNAVLAVVLPDQDGSYEYFLTYNEICKSTTINTPILFKILRENMFNKKTQSTRECNGGIIYDGYASYIHSVKWSDAVLGLSSYIDIALQINQNVNDYNITKLVD